jgi:asparagine synthase (glutamine-hydrolysing)
VCGIVGAVGLRAEPTPEAAAAVLASIRHRGPDASGHVYGDGIWLGSLRLKILDLRDEANQPMRDDETGVTLVYNGEIYNYLELRTLLEDAGHRFETKGDTEVVLRGYLEWGEDLFRRCNGMWALALHDPRRGGVLISRDRFGEKPLYVGQDTDGAWWFGSEAAALRVAGAGSGRYDRARVLNFLKFGDAEDPTGSFFEGIFQLPPGHFALLVPGGRLDPRQWWNLAEFATNSWLDGFGAGDAQEVFDDAVRLRLRSDVAVGASLSGGVDSSAIVASIRHVDPARPLHVFTASFPSHAIDEWERARRVATSFEAEAHRVEPTPQGFVEELPLLVRRQGGPFDSPSVYAQWCVMREAAANDVTVLLDGQGADETWGGYRKYVWFAVTDAILRGHFRSSGKIIRSWRAAADLPGPEPLQIVGLALPPGGRNVARLALRRATRWLGPALRDGPLIDPQGLKLHGPLLLQAAVADSSRVMLPRLLRYADRNSMAWSRELRLPFLDERVVSLGLAAGWRPGFESGWTKERLRQIAAQRLPDEVVWRRGKTAYDVPDRDWLAHPRVRAQVSESVEFLRARQILAPRREPQTTPWRALALAAFLAEHNLAA